MSHTHVTAPTQFVEANGIRFAYRQFGMATGVFSCSTSAAVTDGLGRDRPVILFDNAGVAGSSGDTPVCRLRAASLHPNLD
jgi:hypothetical protein